MAWRRCGLLGVEVLSVSDAPLASTCPRVGPTAGSIIGKLHHDSHPGRRARCAVSLGRITGNWWGVPRRWHTCSESKQSLGRGVGDRRGWRRQDSTEWDHLYCGRTPRGARSLSGFSWLTHLPLRGACPSLDTTTKGDAEYVADEVLRGWTAAPWVVEDMQWADPASHSVVGLLARRIRPDRRRPLRQGDPASGAGARELVTAGFTAVALEPLTPTAPSRSWCCA